MLVGTVGVGSERAPLLKKKTWPEPQDKQHILHKKFCFAEKSFVYLFVENGKI